MMQVWIHCYTEQNFAVVLQARRQRQNALRAVAVRRDGLRRVGHGHVVEEPGQLCWWPRAVRPTDDIRHCVQKKLARQYLH